MKFRFCGHTDCPDWVLAEINSISKLSSVKLKTCTQYVAQAILTPSFDMMVNIEKLFSDSKLDPAIELKSCVACLSLIISSTVRFNCDSTTLHSELQQLGLPREHSTSIRRVVDEYRTQLITLFEKASLRLNGLNETAIEYNNQLGGAVIHLNIGEKQLNQKLLVPPGLIGTILSELKDVEQKMKRLNSS